MEVLFATTQLRRCYECRAQGVRRWGSKIAQRYVDRVNRLYAVDTGCDLHAFPELGFHPLEGDRKGEHALSLDSAWRLVVTFSDRTMTIVRVVEVTKHYGD